MPKSIGNYQVIRSLGEGASCKVKLAIDTRNGTHVALKLMKDMEDEVLHELLVTEVGMCSKLNHPHVVK